MAILELGTNRPGEIARLTEIARPDVALVTNIGPAHLEGFGSVAGVAREKGDIYRGLPSGGTAIINADDEYCRGFELDGSVKSITFGFRAGVDVAAADVLDDGWSGSTFTLKIGGLHTVVNLPLAGRHNIANALAASALAWAAGAALDEIRTGLAACRPVAGRMEVIPLKNGAFVVNDAYNANPASVAGALHTLQAMKGTGQRIAILGDMLELGTEAESRHRDVGVLLAKTGVARAYLRGKLSEATAAGARDGGLPAARIIRFADPAEILDGLLADLSAGDWVLVKGSRGMKMEEVVEALATKIGRKGGEA